jgi:hypothetical protein
MKFLSFLKDKSLYLLINLIIFFIGYLLIQQGNCAPMQLPISNVGNILISIGTSLIAASVVMFLDLIRHVSIAKVLEQLDNLVTEAGLVWIYKKRDIDKYDKLMDTLKGSLDITGYSLGAFFDSYSDKIIAKTSNSSVLIRILIVKPETVFSQSRAIIEGRGQEGFKDRIETLIKFFKGHKNIEIRLLDAPLSTMMFRIDDTMFVGPHFYKKQSKATLTQELKINHWMFTEYQEEFERMWADSVIPN